MESDEEPEMHPYNPFNDEVSPFDYQDPETTSPILVAIMKNDLESIQEMIISGKSLRVVDNNGNSALHFAVASKSYEMVQLLLKQNIDVNHRNYMGFTPLLWAVKYGSVHSIITMLLEAHCDINMKSNNEVSALHLAVTKSSPEIIELLIENGADINAQDGSLFTPLHQAAYSNKLSSLCVLLYYGADTYMFCHKNLTPFMYSVMNLQSSEITEILFHYYDQFTEASTLGDTALHLALIHNNPIAVDLLNAGLNRGFRRSDLKRAITCALEYCSNDMFELVLSQYITGEVRTFNLSTCIECLLRSCSFLESKWTNCCYKFVEFAFDNHWHCNDRLSYILLKLLQHFSYTNFNSDTRYGILCAILSFGVIVEPVHIFEAFCLFRHSTEVELLYQCYNPNLCVNPEIVPCTPLYYFHTILRSKTGYEIQQHLDTFASKWLVNIIDIRSTPAQDLLYYCRFITFSLGSLQNFNKLPRGRKYTTILELLEKLPRVPSLIEISRNASVVLIVSKFNITLAYQFFDIVKRMMIPHVLKDILLFKKPLY